MITLFRQQPRRWAHPLVWFKSDDQLPDHRKVRKLGKDKLPAMGLWELCGCWASRELTDGFVPDEIVQRDDADHRYAKRLVAVGLWVRVEIDGEHGYQYHDWSDWNPIKAEVEAKREAARERMRNLRSDKPKRAKRSLSVRANTKRTDEERSPHVRDLFATPDPTRTKELPNGSSHSRAHARGASDLFAEFYAVYPKHVGRKAAEKAWRTAVKDADPAVIIAGAKRYADERRDADPRYTKQPATWLNQGCWMDEPQQPRAGPSGYQPFRNPTDQDVYDEPLLPRKE